MRSALLVALAFACTVCSHHPFADVPASGVVYCDQHGIALQSTRAARCATTNSSDASVSSVCLHAPRTTRPVSRSLKSRTNIAAAFHD